MDQPSGEVECNTVTEAVLVLDDKLGGWQWGASHPMSPPTLLNTPRRSVYVVAEVFAVIHRARRW